MMNSSIGNLVAWNAALASVRAGRATARIACIGDSETAGYGSTGNANLGARAASYPSHLALILNAAYAPAQADSFFGDAHAAVAGTAGYPLYDPRVTMGAGWSTFSAPPANALGGLLFDSLTATTPLRFTPPLPVDRFDVYFLANSNFSVNVDGGAALVTIADIGGPNAMAKITVSCALGMHTVNLVPTGAAPLYIVGVNAYDSAVKKIAVMNVGFGGAKATDWADTTYAWSALNCLPALAPDLSLIMLGANDWQQGVGPSAYLAAVQAILTVATTTGSAVLIVPPPSNPSAASYPTSVAVQKEYASCLYALADKNAVPVIDFMAKRGTFAEAQAAGFTSDDVHPSGAGYFDMAKTIATAIAGA